MHDKMFEDATECGVILVVQIYNCLICCAIYSLATVEVPGRQVTATECASFL